LPISACSNILTILCDCRLTSANRKIVFAKP
jgi:hypothetical protein